MKKGEHVKQILNRLFFLRDTLASAFSSFRQKPDTLTLLDVQECLSSVPIRQRQPRDSPEPSTYYLYYEDIPIEADDFVTNHIKLLEKYQIVDAINSILKQWVELSRLYPQHIRKFSADGSWGDNAHKSSTPGHIALDLKLGARLYRLDRFAGDPEISDNGVGYGYFEFRIFVDGILIFRGRKYNRRPGPFQNSVAIIESHLSPRTINEVLSLANLNNFRMEINRAKTRLKSRRRARHGKTIEILRLKFMSEAQREAFEPFEDT